MAALRQLPLQLHALWSASTGRQRATALGSFLLSSAALAALVFWGTTRSFVPLMTDLSPEDASSIVQFLSDEHVPHRIVSGGTAIVVPDDQVHAIRLKLAGQGLPRGGGVGFEIFDESSISNSRFVDQLNYERALQGELGRTIQQLDPVRGARVHIVSAQQSLFKEQEKGASASITVQLYRNRSLSVPQTQAIVHLVASSVRGLTPDNVTVVDGAGRILAKGGDDSAESDSTLEHQHKFERRMESRVREILERVVGQGRASVRASAEFDFSKSETTAELYNPDNFVLRSEHIKEEENNSDSAGARGIPGARSNLTGGEVSSGKGKATASSRRNTTRNFEIDKTIRHEVQASIQLKRLSVAVLVDFAQQQGPNGGIAAVPRDASELTRLTDLVKHSVGFSEARGDSVDIQSMAFSDQLPDVAPVDAAWKMWVEKLWRPAIAVFALLIFAIAMLRKRSSLPSPRLLQAPASVREVEASLMQGLPTATSQAQDELPAAASPEQAAGVIRSWISERRENVG